MIKIKRKTIIIGIILIFSLFYIANASFDTKTAIKNKLNAECVREIITQDINSKQRLVIFESDLSSQAFGKVAIKFGVAVLKKDLLGLAWNVERISTKTVNPFDDPLPFDYASGRNFSNYYYTAVRGNDMRISHFVFTMKEEHFSPEDYPIALENIKKYPEDYNKIVKSKFGYAGVFGYDPTDDKLTVRAFDKDGKMIAYLHLKNSDSSEYVEQ